MSEKENNRLLIVDDDPGIRRQLKWGFGDYETVECGDRASAVKAVKARSPAVVLLDLGLPPDPDGPSEGLQALREILQASPTSKIIVMTGQKERSHAVRAVGLGAYDFYEKPLDLDELTLIVRRARNLYTLEYENRALQARANRGAIPGLITSNPELQKVSEQVHRLAASSVSVLIFGESGTGKELVARALHVLGPRKQGAYVAINCAAIPENLLESELFGHEKGAFTGAHKTMIGKIEQAHQGTLLLDEIAELPLSLQAKLLRVLQERTVERVGGRKSIAVDFRLVCATNRDLQQAIKDQSFREDLYYRLGEVTVTIPPLRERPEDALMIAQKFLEDWCREQDIASPGFAADALAAIAQYDWPGNVRELQSRIKRATAVAEGKITTQDLDLQTPDQEPVYSVKVVRRQAEADAVRRAMAQAGGNISEAARLLDVSRPTLYQLLEEHGLR